MQAEESPGCTVSWEKLFSTSSAGDFKGQKVMAWALNHVLCSGSFRLVLCQVCFKFQLYVGFERGILCVFTPHPPPDLLYFLHFVCGGLFWFWFFFLLSPSTPIFEGFHCFLIYICPTRFSQVTALK